MGVKYTVHNNEHHENIQSVDYPLLNVGCPYSFSQYFVNNLQAYAY